MTICDLCGWANRAGALFCAHCGDPLPADRMPAPLPALTDATAPAGADSPMTSAGASDVSGTPTTLLEFRPHPTSRWLSAVCCKDAFRSSN